MAIVLGKRGKERAAGGGKSGHLKTTELGIAGELYADEQPSQAFKLPESHTPLKNRLMSTFLLGLLSVGAVTGIYFKTRPNYTDTRLSWLQLDPNPAGSDPFDAQSQFEQTSQASTPLQVAEINVPGVGVPNTIPNVVIFCRQPTLAACQGADTVQVSTSIFRDQEIYVLPVAGDRVSMTLGLNQQNNQEYYIYGNTNLGVWYERVNKQGQPVDPNGRVLESYEERYFVPASVFKLKVPNGLNAADVKKVVMTAAQFSQPGTRRIRAQ